MATNLSTEAFDAINRMANVSAAEFNALQGELRNLIVGGTIVIAQLIPDPKAFETPDASFFRTFAPSKDPMKQRKYIGTDTPAWTVMFSLPMQVVGYKTVGSTVPAAPDATGQPGVVDPTKRSVYLNLDLFGPNNDTISAEGKVGGSTPDMTRDQFKQLVVSVFGPTAFQGANAALFAPKADQSLKDYWVGVLCKALAGKHVLVKVSKEDYDGGSTNRVNKLADIQPEALRNGFKAKGYEYPLNQLPVAEKAAK